jgi:hypothetical protein
MLELPLQPRAQKKTARTRRVIVRRGGVGTTFSVAFSELRIIALSRYRTGEHHPHIVGRLPFLPTRVPTLPTVSRRSAARFPLAPSGDRHFSLRDPLRSNTAHTRSTESNSGYFSPELRRETRNNERESRSFANSRSLSIAAEKWDSESTLPEMCAAVIAHIGRRPARRRHERRETHN